MTSEEMQKTIEFMLEHQAKFDAQQQLLQEDLKTLTAIVTRVVVEAEADRQITKNAISKLVEIVGGIHNRVIKLEDKKTN